MIILSISLTTVLLLLVDNSSEPQFLQSKVFPSEISSLNDIRDSLEGVLDDNPWFIKYIQKKSSEFHIKDYVPYILPLISKNRFYYVSSTLHCTFW